MQSLLKDIKGLVGAYKKSPRFVAGKEMKQFPVTENAWMLFENGIITDFGTMGDCPEVNIESVDVVDCSGRFVLPSWCDSHTH